MVTLIYNSLKRIIRILYQIKCLLFRISTNIQFKNKDPAYIETGSILPVGTLFIGNGIRLSYVLLILQTLLMLPNICSGIT